MDRIIVPAKGWVLVCDGSKALLFKNAGDAQAINLQAVTTLHEWHPPSRDLGTERPGRAVDSHDGSRSAVGNADLHQEAETKFLHEVALKLDQAVHEHQIKALVIAAAPKALGVLRDCLTPATKQVVTGEIAKDLVKLPTLEIERHLQAMWAQG